MKKGGTVCGPAFVFVQLAVSWRHELYEPVLVAQVLGYFLRLTNLNSEHDTLWGFYTPCFLDYLEAGGLLGQARVLGAVEEGGNPLGVREVFNLI